MSTRTAWAVKVYGVPATKGSMRCIGGRGKVKHQLINQLPTTEPWQSRIAEAGVLLGIEEPHLGPVGVQITITVDRPKSVSFASRPYPHIGAGDVDKFARAVLDGLEQAGVYKNDAQVCSLTTDKAYPDSPDRPDQLTRSGAFIRIYLIANSPEDPS